MTYDHQTILIYNTHNCNNLSALDFSFKLLFKMCAIHNNFQLLVKSVFISSLGHIEQMVKFDEGGNGVKYE